MPPSLTRNLRYHHSMKPASLDDIDMKILRILQAAPEINISDVGEKVGLSHTPCWRRIRKMQESGLLKGRVWLVDPELAGQDVSIFVFVRLDTHSAEVMDAFEKATLDIAEILQCYTVSGEFDYMLRVVVASVRDYERAVKGKLLKLPHVGIMNSHFALNEVKNTTSLPI